jgi:hypothetical protein
MDLRARVPDRCVGDKDRLAKEVKRAIRERGKEPSTTGQQELKRTPHRSGDVRPTDKAPLKNSKREKVGVPKKVS